MSFGEDDFDENRRKAVAHKIEQLLKEKGPMEKDRIADEFNQERPWVYTALNDKRFCADDTGRIHLTSDAGE